MKFFFCARIGIYMMNKSKMEIFWTYMSRWNGKKSKKRKTCHRQLFLHALVYKVIAYL